MNRDVMRRVEHAIKLREDFSKLVTEVREFLFSVKDTRDRSMALTKLDELEMWGTRAVEKDM